MVTKAEPPNKPNGSEPLKTMPKVEPAKMVSGAAFVGQPAISPNDAEPKIFKLPETVSTEDIKKQSYRYGGGRSSGSTQP